MRRTLIAIAGLAWAALAVGCDSAPVASAPPAPPVTPQPPTPPAEAAYKPPDWAVAWIEDEKRIPLRQAPPHCGLLKYVSDYGGVFLYKGVGTGRVQVVLSANGRVIRRTATDVTAGAEYRFESGGDPHTLSFECL